MKRLRLLAASCGLAIASAVVLLNGPASATTAAAPTLDWSTVSPATSPPPLAYAAAAYDADTSPPSLVLFGGLESNGVMSGSTWVWNGSTWTQFTGGPTARDLASMAFDPELNQLILFGGQNAAGTLLDDTWAWNGQSWCELSAGSGLAGTCSSSKISSPPAREGAALSLDPNGYLVLFGGTGYAATPASPTTDNPAQVVAGEKTLSDTWLWKGTTTGWVQESVTGPPARSGAAMTYDSASHTTVMFGGESTAASTPEAAILGDTWTWNGSAWAQVKPATSPPGRDNAVFDYDPSLDGSLLVAGEGKTGVTKDAWLWSGGYWTQATVDTTASPRQGAAAGYDSASSDLVIFGGSGGGGLTLGDTGLVTVASGQTTSPSSTTTTTIAGHKSTTTTTTGSNRSGGKSSSPTTASKSHSSPTTVPAQPSSPTTAPTGHGATAVTASLEASARNVRQGATVRVSGTGFAPGTRVMITFHSVPDLLGWAVADDQGRFSAEVSVPAKATVGEHHIVASGQSADGHTATLTAALYVDRSGGKGIPTRTKWFLMGLAVLIPVATYLVMTTAGLVRQRRPAAPVPAPPA